MAKEHTVKMVMVDGNPFTAKIMIISPPLTEEELGQGLPLVGPSGTMVWSLLKKHGIDRADCYIVSVIGEMPGAPNGKEISKLQWDDHWVSFDEAIMPFEGHIVVCLGKEALWRFTGEDGGIDTWRGYLIYEISRFIDRPEQVKVTIKSGPNKGKEKYKTFIRAVHTPKWLLKDNPLVVIATYDPATVMRMQNTTLPVLSADLNRAARATRGELKVPTFLYDKFSLGVGPVAFDIETDGIEGGISLMGFAQEQDTGMKTFSADWGGTAREATKVILGDPDTVKVAHNSCFDITRLNAAGVEVNGELVDTMMQAALLQPDIPKGLKYVAPMYLDIPRWNDGDDKKLYNAQDCVYTLELYKILDEQLEKHGQKDLFYSIVMPGVKELILMHQTGMHVDKNKAATWISMLKQKVQKTLKLLLAYSSIDFMSHTQIKKYLYVTLGLEKQYDAQGKVTTNEEALRKLMSLHPEHQWLIGLILSLRSDAHDLSTYASITTDSTGMIHPNFLPAGKNDENFGEDGKKTGKGLAGTFRPIAKNPPVQQQPPAARKLYTPRTPGYFFAEFDYTAFEARILAALAEDEALKEAIETGLHKNNMALLGVDKVRAKNAFYGWSYGAGYVTLRRTFRAHGFDVSPTDCKKMLRTFDGKYHKSVAWRKHQLFLAKAQHYVENPFGFRRYFYTRSPGMAAANTPIQSTAAFILWTILPQLGRAVRAGGGFFVCTVHDSVEFELPEGFDLKVIKDIMEQPFDNIAPGFYVPVECKVGPSWGDLEEYKL